MKIKIIGARHAIELEQELLEKIDEQIAGIKGDKIKLGLEVVKQKERQQRVWKRVIAHLQKNKRVQIVFLESPTGERISGRTADYYLKLESKWILTGMRPSKQEMRELDRGKYVVTVLRDKSLLRRIVKTKPDLAVVGAEHAFVIGESLGIEPMYVGCKAADVARYAKKRRAALRYITRAKARRVEQRKMRRKPKI